jgi:hypothetical protein
LNWREIELGVSFMVFLQNESHDRSEGVE